VALLADADRRAALGTAARAAAAGHYAWDAIARRHLDLYATLAR
jgi:glycosyltransferase involved in cell wall biosynthesis